jgi:hypothetical protein
MTMTEQTAARVAPAAEGPELTEHVNVLMTEDTRAFLLGSKIADGARSEAAVARALLDNAIERFAAEDGCEMDRRMEIGRAELVRRTAARPQ